MNERTDVPDVAPFATWWTCDSCGREWPADSWERAKLVCACDEDTLRNDLADEAPR